jgi:hypothetical protein
MITTTASTRLYELAQIAAEKTQQRFKAAKFNAADELHSFNNNTNWDALNRKEFRDIMIRMESVTVQFYNDFGDCTYPSRHVAIKAFWANEWGCEYLPESGKWRDCDSGSIIKSETEKKAKRDAKKALKKDEKRKLKQHDEEDEAYAEAYAQARAEKDQALEQARAEQKAQAQAQNAQAQNAQAQEQSKKQQQLDAEFDEEEDAWADAYAQAALARAEKEKAQQQQQQDEAQAYLDSFNYTSEEEQEEQEEPVTTRICCQAVLYIEELTETKGDPDWRAYIYYDARIRRYVLKGTRRSLRATSKKTVFPEIKLCFRSSRELAHYLCSSTDSLLNVSMLAMASATVRDATFAELYALPAHGCKTELFGYDETRPRYSTFVNYLCMVKDVDATHSTFASF